MNDDFLKKKKNKIKKIHGNIFSSNVLKRWSFQKGPRRDMIFLVLSGKVVFFHRKNGIFSRTENKRERETTFLKKYTETWYFLFDMLHAPLPKRIKDDPIPQKYT